MTRLLTKFMLPVVALVLAAVLIIGAFLVARNLDLLSVFGIDSTSRDSQVVNAVERTQEVSLLSLAVQGIKDEQRNGTIFGQKVPGSGEKVFLKFEFEAKLGVDGAEVRVEKIGESAYLVSVPEFQFIGYDQPTFEVITEDSGVMSSFTRDIDKVEMINEVLNGDARDSYLASNDAALRDQTKVFYNSLITSIDPAGVATYEFRP